MLGFLRGVDNELSSKRLLLFILGVPYVVMIIKTHLYLLKVSKVEFALELLHSFGWNFVVIFGIVFGDRAFKMIKDYAILKRK